MRTLPASLVAALLLVAAAAPRPATIHEGDADDGRVHLHPAASVVEASPASGVEVPFALTNGTDAPVVFDVSSEDVVLASDGAPSPSGSATGPATWMTFAEGQVTVPAGAVAHAAAVLQVPAEAQLPALVAIRATVEGQEGPGLVAYLGIGAPGGAADVSVAVSTERNGSRDLAITTVTNAGDTVALVATRTVVRTWYGRDLVDVTSGPYLVDVRTPRTLGVAFRAPTLPGPYTASSVVTAGTQVVRGQAVGSSWNARTTTAAATVLLMIAASGLVWARRRATVRGPSAADDGPQA